MPGPLLLPSRPSRRGAATSSLMVVIRAYVVSQANHMGFMIGGVKTQYPAENKHGRLVELVCYSSLFTLTQSLLHLRNLALSLLRACWGHFCPKFGGGGAQKHFIGGVNSMFKIKIQISCGHFDIKLTY